MYDIIYKYFRDERVKYFQSSDAYSILAGDTYITYKINSPDRVVLYLGGTEIDETPVRVCSTPQQLEKLIEAIIY